MRVTAQAPTRVDLAGGTLDLWPLHRLLKHKATVNVAVNLEAKVEIEISADRNYNLISQDQNRKFSGSFQAACEQGEIPLFGQFLEALWRADWTPITIKSTARSPAGAGLGGSSSLAIALGAALWKARRLFNGKGGELHQNLSEDRLVTTAQDIEASLIRVPTGCQDYWAAVRGGINVISYPAGKVDVVTLPIDTLKNLKTEILLAYSGKSRASASNNWEIFRQAFDGDQSVISKLNDIGEVAYECANAALNGDYEGVKRLSQEEWQLRKRLWPEIEVPQTAKLADAALENGALFSRVCGAGGGGVMIIFTPEEQRRIVSQALVKAGGVVLPADVCNDGLKVRVEGVN